MGEPIEGEYFNWLCAKVLPPNGIRYHDLLKILYTTEFVWVVSGDRNREDDGLELRQYFLNETRQRMNRPWFEEPCSVLEMLIAFAQRAQFQTDTPAENWFWEFMNNLELSDYAQITDSDARVINEKIHTLIWRTYEPSGYGGMFPLWKPKRDQRKVEIWYQFCEYLDDRGLM